MKIEAIDHINFSVNNLSESIDWYHKIFGFDVVEKNQANGVKFAILKSNSSMLCIYEFPSRSFKDRFELHKSKLHGMNHFSFRISNQADFEKIVKKHDIEVGYDGPVKWPHSTSWYVTDPTGYEIEVVLWNEGKIRFPTM